MIQVQSNSLYIVDWNIDVYDGQEFLVDLIVGSYMVLVINFLGCMEFLMFDLEVNDESLFFFIICLVDMIILLFGVFMVMFYFWDLFQVVDNCIFEE